MELLSIVLIVLLLGLQGLLFFFRHNTLWRKSLERDLDDLLDHRETRSPQARKALGIVAATCRTVLKTRRPGDDPQKILARYLESLAGCFHPESREPLLEATPARILQGIEGALPDYERLLNRPGFATVARLSLADLEGLLPFSSASAGETRPSLFKKILHVRSLGLLRTLAADVILVLGCLTVAIFDDPAPVEAAREDDDLEETLRELSGLDDRPLSDWTGEIQRLRNSLVGLPGILVNEPTPSAMMETLVQVAMLVAATHFPQSDRPLDQARIGPLLTRGRMFLVALSNPENMTLKRKILSIRLSTLLRARSLGRAVVPRPVRDMAEKALKNYGWLKWPLRFYLAASNGVFFKFAADAGWYAGRKALLVLFFGRFFDLAVREIDQVYRLSRQTDES